MRDLLLAATIFGSIPFIFYRPHIGVLVWAWLSFMTPFNYAWSFAVGFRWAYLIAAVTVVAWLISREPKRISFSPPSVLLIVFWAFTGLTTMFAMFPDPAHAKWIEFTKVVAIDLVVTVALFADRRRLNALIWVIVASIGFFGVKGGIATLVTGGTIHIAGVNNSILSSNNFLASALLMTIPLMRYLQVATSERTIKWGLILSILLSMIAVLGTQSRGGLLGLLVLSTLLFIRSPQKLTIAFAFIAVCTVGVVFMPESWTARMESISSYQTDASVQERFKSWEFGYELAQDHPVFGGGFEAYRANLDPTSSVGYRTAHSIYLDALGEHGFVGLILYLLFIGSNLVLAASLLKRTRRDPNLKWAHDLVRMTQTSFIVFMFTGAAIATTYFELLIFLSSITICVHRITRSYERQQWESKESFDQTPIPISTLYTATTISQKST